MSENRKWKKGAGNGVVSGRTTLAAIESLAIPLVQEVVFLADFKCSRCQQRVAEIMSKMNGETQSVMISVLDKKVTLICTYDNDYDSAAAKNPNPARRRPLTRVYQNPWTKAVVFLRLLRTSSGH
ncbi:uncharacterized protein LOC127261161 [Andrographis paniculata]|uniref:uncharacterized protein LOC127261161 n=1 Tax=Andrographis paniculata TaxID=175694 RepID=UPI0021E8A1A3|nr:uncharacterized protein LOC127261161 [Andrographis paniculata]